MESKQECKDCNKSLEDCTCIEDTIDMKQETLEEASLLSRPIHLIWDEDERYDCNEEFREEFKKGAKWQIDKQDNFAVGFAEWSVARALGCDKFTINQDELNIYKKYIDTLNGN